MYKHPKNINIDGQIYDLKHMSPWELKVNIPAQDKNPEIDVTLYFHFSNHCYTEGVETSNLDPKPLIMDNQGRRRQFCKKRYGNSIELREILKNTNTKYCLFTGRENWLIVNLKNEAGREYKYHIYFSIKRHRQEKNALIVWVETAFIKDRGNNQPKRGKSLSRIKFEMLVRKTIKNEKIVKPRNF